jgi:hypothetical protein
MAKAEGVVSSRAGITTRPDVMRKEWLKEYPDMRHWEQVGPFATPEEAQRWERKQRGCERSGAGDERDFLGSRWYGYRFEY